MFLNYESQQLRTVHGITDLERDAIKLFLQGAVYCWCKNRHQEWFSLRDLMGGENFYWQGTPLLCLFTKHETEGKDNPTKEAGKDAGWLLKSVVAEDRRTFKTKKEDLIRKYCWVD